MSKTKVKKGVASKPDSDELAKQPEPLPERTPEEQALIDRAKHRRRIDEPPRVKLETKNADGTSYIRADGDIDLEVAKLTRDFGLKDWVTAQVLSQQLANVATPLKPGDIVNSTNVATALVQEIGPRDGVEAMLAIQMVATHAAAIELLRRAALPQHSIEIYDSITNRATKLLRTYTAQVETLNRYRNAGRQTITVNHIGQVNAEIAAIAVGCTTGGPGLSEKNGELPYVRAGNRQLDYRPEEDMRSQGQTQRQTVPATANGERAVLPPRRRKSGRSTGTG
jgi:hypothetical protein